MCLGDFFWLSNKTWANRAVLTFFYSVYEKFLTQKKELLLLPLSKYICTFNLFVCHYGWVLHLVGFTWTSLCLGIFKETFTKRADFVCVYCRGYAEVGKLYRHNLKCVLCSQIKFQTSPHPPPKNQYEWFFFDFFGMFLSHSIQLFWELPSKLQAGEAATQSRKRGWRFEGTRLTLLWSQCTTGGDFEGEKCGECRLSHHKRKTHVECTLNNTATYGQTLPGEKYPKVCYSQSLLIINTLSVTIDRFYWPYKSSKRIPTLWLSQGVMARSILIENGNVEWTRVIAEGAAVI